METNKIKTGLVLSGGGAKGRFQIGALTALMERGVTFDCIAGVSVGSLNGSMLAQGEMDKLVRVWENLRSEDIYTKPSYLTIAWNLLVKKHRSVYNAQPLLDRIRENVNINKVKTQFYLGLTSLVTGKYYGLSHQDFHSNEDFQNGVYASSLMPILWEPTQVETKGGLILDAVDGGLRNISPLAEIVKEMPDKIYIINCNRTQNNIETPNTIIKVIVRTFIDIILSEVIATDVSELLRINELVKQAGDRGFILNHPDGRPYKYFEVELIEPDDKLGSPIVFEPSVTKAAFDMGYRLAKR